MTRLQDLRLEKNLSQSQFSKLCGVKTGVLQMYEQGARNLDGAQIKTLLNLSTSLGCRISDLIENDALRVNLKKHGY